MHIDSIAPLALSIARSVLRWGWDAADIEDAAQEAALHIWTAMQRTPDAGRGYYAAAGYRGARGWMAAQCRNADSLRALADCANAGLDAERRGWHDGKPWQEPLTDEERDRLVQILARGRRKPASAERDAWIVQALSRGLTQMEIGNELGISRWHVGVLRQRIRTALSRGGNDGLCNSVVG